MLPVWLLGASGKAPAHVPGPSLSYSHSHDGGWIHTTAYGADHSEMVTRHQVPQQLGDQ
jgi:hypothetical protein